MSYKTTISAKDLSLEQIEEILYQAEQVGRSYIYRQIPAKEIKTLEIVIDFDYKEELTIECIITIECNNKSQKDPKRVSDEAVEKVFEFLEGQLKLNSSGRG